MKAFLRDFFTFSPGEVRAVYVLTIILIITLMLRFYTDNIRPPQFHPSEDELAEIDEFINAFNKRSDNGFLLYDSLSNFDPNKISSEEMKKMGFHARVITNISRYRKAGGRFRKAGDMRKIYGMTDSVFSLIKPFVHISDSLKAPAKLDLNNSDSATLVSLYGIGPVLAARIIKFQRLLGGYHDPSQLLEVYGIDSLLFQSIRNSIYADTTGINKLDINKATEAELRRHPYIGRNNAEAIIRFREHRGRISNIQDLRTFNVLNEIDWQNIRFYIKI